MECWKSSNERRASAPPALPSRSKLVPRRFTRAANAEPANPCIKFPFASEQQTKLFESQGDRLQQLESRVEKHQLERTASNPKELYQEYGDLLCDLGRFPEALCAYAKAIAASLRSADTLQVDLLRHFIGWVTKLTSSDDQQTSWDDPHLNVPKLSKGQQVMTYTVKYGQPCPDPWSCPTCAGVLVEPVSLPCGHTFCRSHVVPPPKGCSSVASRLCQKCHAPWRTDEPRLVCNLAGQLERQMSNPNEDLNAISTNSLVNTLVKKYWTPDLEAIQMRNKANQLFAKGQLQQALDMYNKAFQLAPGDHLLVGNRSATYHKMGKCPEALADADLAISFKPDWAKAYYRKGVALQSMDRHAEAFQAFFECLSLEDGQAKAVKLELAKELYIMLNQSSKQSAELDAGSLSTVSSSSCSESEAPLDFTAKDLPQCLYHLANYMDQLSRQRHEGKTNNQSTWLAKRLQTYEKTSRHIESSCVESSDYECPLCYRLLWQPMTTPCGHTFCRTCLDRVLDHNATCPLCKSATLKSYLTNRRHESNVNEFVESSMIRLLPNEYADRQRIHDEEMKELAGASKEVNQGQIPIFVCTMSFPSIPCPLHVFEPRYRLMIRRCMEVGTREFGMCCKLEGDQPFADYGTMLEIRDIQFFPDGRSVVDTVGSRRFKVASRSTFDGYHTAEVEFLADETVPEDQLSELKQLHDETYQWSTKWLNNMEDNIKSGIMAHYGNLPETEQDYWTLSNGPAWPWWILAILPLEHEAQLKILSLTTLQKRLEAIKRILKYIARTENKSKK